MSESSHSTNDKPVIGISIGDINGIGPEVTLKALTDHRITKLLTPVIYADSRVITFYKKHLDLQNFSFFQAKHINNIQHKKINVINLAASHGEITPGTGNERGGKYALESLKQVLEDLKNGKLDAMVTAPLSKELVQSENFNFPGHTEYLTQEAGAKDSLMFLVADDLRVGVVTGHIPLKDVSTAASAEKIRIKLNLMLKALKKDFGIKKPRVAVLGLNPHAGENGLLGTEEAENILPVIQAIKDKGELVFGPFAADGFFGSSQFKSYDGILAMYHDQGLIPFKNMAFENGVNFTAGLSFVRTSPDHGTAFPIAGKGIADETSMRSAIFTAAEIVKSRKEMK